ncbi:unnamed protein product [Nippostrongylus brasiliensis]|uniref:Uncharacterized protein n=1 Tax=Nippostrongylus brasiliensis TaxID=27835 RepID=A0A0N4YJ87_NIPBR|nr:unnamed protein product [Nippostrongylus brasiliensis]
MNEMEEELEKELEKKKEKEKEKQEEKKKRKKMERSSPAGRSTFRDSRNEVSAIDFVADLRSVSTGR